MNKYIRFTKFSKKQASKYAKLCLDETKTLFASHISSMGPYNKLLTMKTTSETGKNKNPIEKRQKKVSKQFKS